MVRDCLSSAEPSGIAALVPSRWIAHLGSGNIAEMSWLSRLLGRKRRSDVVADEQPAEPAWVAKLPRARVVAEPEGFDRAASSATAPSTAWRRAPAPVDPPAPSPTDPMEAILSRVAGIHPLAGEREQLRVTYSGTWDGPLFITIALPHPTATEAGEVAVVDPGDDFRPLVMAALSGQPASLSPTLEETRAPLAGHHIPELRALLAGDAVWSLADGDLRGTDGHWITVEVFSPRRGRHVARDWCPYPDSKLGRAAAVILRAAAADVPELAEHHWVTSLWRAS